MATTQIILSLIKLFLMIIPGVILSKAHIIDEHQSKGISALIVNVTWPCLIISSLQREFSKELCINMGILAIVMVIAVIVAYVLARGIGHFLRLPKEKVYLMTFMLMFGNTGFMGIPVCTALYGSEGTFYAALIDCMQDIFIFTVGLFLMQKSTGAEIRFNFRGFLTPGFASIVVGLALFLLGITLPQVISVPVDTVGSATSPLAMIVVGYQLGNIRIKELISDHRLYILSAFKLIVMPLLFMAAILLIFPEMDLLTKALIVELAAPVAACTTIYAQQYDSDVRFATTGVMLSTVLSLVSLSAFAVVVELI